MRVLVTGSTGLIGSHLCRELLEAGHDVRSLSRSSQIAGLATQHCQADVASAEARGFASQAQAIVHLAALSDASLSYQRPTTYAETNAQGTLNMLEAARQSGAHFILASSQRIYKPRPTPVKEDSPLEPVDPYGYSKLVAETWCQMYARLFDLPVTIFRFFSVYGPGQRPAAGSSGVVGIFVRRAVAGLGLMARGNVFRDFTYVTDVTAALATALDHPRPGIFNVATGIATSVLDLAHLTREIAGAASEICEEPGSDEGSYVADIALAREVLGYEPRVSLREGLEQYVRWVRDKSQSPA